MNREPFTFAILRMKFFYLHVSCVGALHRRIWKNDNFARFYLVTSSFGWHSYNDMICWPWARRNDFFFSKKRRKRKLESYDKSNRQANYPRLNVSVVKTYFLSQGVIIYQGLCHQLSNYVTYESMLGNDIGMLARLPTIMQGYVHTIPDHSFCAGTNILPHRVSDFGAFSMTKRCCAAPFSKLERHISDSGSYYSDSHADVTYCWFSVSRHSK